MTKPKAKNQVLELTISVGTKKFFLTLEEAQQLQKILNSTLIQPPVGITWGYSPSESNS